MTAKVVGLVRYPEKGKSGEAQTALTLISGVGISGDFHNGSDRQVSLLSAEARQWMDSSAEKGLCFAKFSENILIEDLASVKVGDSISIGDAVLQIVQSGKRCYSECSLFSSDSPCQLAKSALFANVQYSGMISIGDKVYSLL